MQIPWLGFCGHGSKRLINLVLENMTNPSGMIVISPGPILMEGILLVSLSGVSFFGAVHSGACMYIWSATIPCRDYLSLTPSMLILTLWICPTSALMCLRIPRELALPNSNRAAAMAVYKYCILCHTSCSICIDVWLRFFWGGAIEPIPLVL